MNHPNRKSIRLKGYDYSQEGLYFITICCYQRAHLFGKVGLDSEGKTIMILNEAGKMAEQCWKEIPNHFPNVIIHEFIIMPNHIHGIIEFVGANNHSPVEANNHSPVEANNHSPQTNEVDWANNDSPQQGIDQIERANNHSSRPRGTSKTVGSVVRGFKIGVTKWFRQNKYDKTVWQRNYYEHIIRNANAYQRISNYIIENPKKWREDCFYK
ncbi:MAG: transposase [Flavobacterium sp.]